MTDIHPCTLVDQFSFTVTPLVSGNKLLRGKWTEHNSRLKYLRQLRGYNLVHGLKGRRLFVALRIMRMGRRALDVDNLYTGAKPLIDAMKQTDLIVDDNAEWCNYIITQCKVRHATAEMTVVQVRRYIPREGRADEQTQ